MTKRDTCTLCYPRRGVITRGPFWTMVVNENQALLGRVYFALNRHETDATSLNADEQAELFGWFARAKSALDALFSPDHYNFVMLMNIEPHVHAHIIPRYQAPRDFGGEIFTDEKYGDHYDPGAVKILSEEAFDSLGDALRDAIPPGSTIVNKGSSTS